MLIAGCMQTLSLVNGITCAAYNGSVVESAARLLVDTVGMFVSVCLSVCLFVCLCLFA